VGSYKTEKYVELVKTLVRTRANGLQESFQDVPRSGVTRGVGAGGQGQFFLKFHSTYKFAFFLSF